MERACVKMKLAAAYAQNVVQYHENLASKTLNERDGRGSSTA